MSHWRRRTKYLSGVQTSCEILAILASNKEYAQYDLPKAVEKDYRTVLRHLKGLEGEGLIRLARTQPAKKGGKDRKIYTLTLLGLVAILKLYLSAVGDRDFNAEFIDTMATNYPDSFPLLFGKWQFYEEHGLKNLIVNRLKKALKNYPLSNPLSWFIEGRMEDSELLELFMYAYDDGKVARKHLKELREAQKGIITASEQMIKDIVTRKVLVDLPFEDPKQFHDFLAVACEDNDLRAFIDKVFLETEKEYEAHLNNIRSLRQGWQQLISKTRRT